MTEDSVPFVVRYKNIISGVMVALIVALVISISMISFLYYRELQTTIVKLNDLQANAKMLDLDISEIQSDIFDIESNFSDILSSIKFSNEVIRVPSEEDGLGITRNRIVTRVLDSLNNRRICYISGVRLLENSTLVDTERPERVTHPHCEIFEFRGGQATQYQISSFNMQCIVSCTFLDISNSDGQR